MRENITLISFPVRVQHSVVLTARYVSEVILSKKPESGSYHIEFKGQDCGSGMKIPALKTPLKPEFLIEVTKQIAKNITANSGRVPMNFNILLSSSMLSALEQWRTNTSERVLEHYTLKGRQLDLSEIFPDFFRALNRAGMLSNDFKPVRFKVEQPLSNHFRITDVYVVASPKNLDDGYFIELIGDNSYEAIKIPVFKLPLKAEFVIEIGKQLSIEVSKASGKISNFDALINYSMKEAFKEWKMRDIFDRKSKSILFGLLDRRPKLEDVFPKFQSLLAA